MPKKSAKARSAARVKSQRLRSALKAKVQKMNSGTPQENLLLKAVGNDAFRLSPESLRKDPKMFELVKRLARGMLPYSQASMLATSDALVIGTVGAVFSSAEGLPLSVALSVCSLPTTHIDSSEFLALSDDSSNKIILFSRHFGTVQCKKSDAVYYIPLQITKLAADMRKWEPWQAEQFLNIQYKKRGARHWHPKSKNKLSLSNLVQLRRINRFPKKKQIRKERELSGAAETNSIDMSYSQG